MLLLTAIILIVICLVWLLHRRHQSSKRVSSPTTKCVLISGCDTGFGRAMVKRLDARGVPTFAGCYTTKGLEELRDETSQRSKAFKLDVGDGESVKQAFEFVRGNLLPDTELWGLVNNAGILGATGPLEFMDDSEFETAWNINFMGAVRMTRTFLPLLKESRGRVVLVSSVMEYFTMPKMLPYGASKAAIRSLGDAMRVEKKQWGISVSVLFPGGFQTNITGTAIENIKRIHQKLSLDVRESYGEDYLKTEMERTIGHGTKMPHCSTSLEPVLSAYDHALFSLHPRRYYRPGKDSAIFYVLSCVLPVAFFDKVVTKVRSKNLPLGVKKLRENS